MPDLLFELCCEEIPAPMQRKAVCDLQEAIGRQVNEAGLFFKQIKSYWTHRRLVFYIRELDSCSIEKDEEIKGPSTNASEAAIQGFLRKAGFHSIQQAQIKTASGSRGDFYVARIVKPECPANEIISEVIPRTLASFSWPKSMRWGPQSIDTSSFRWIRPIRSILCTITTKKGSQIVGFEIGGIRSSNISWGHKFYASEKIIINHFDDYSQKLNEAKVILCAEKRKEIIQETARDLAQKKGLHLLEDEALLEEITGLVEWPVVLMGSFDPAFLSMPPELIKCTIRVNQKCFVTTKPLEEGKQINLLSNQFILVSNIEAKDGGKEIIRGNERVIHARLSDALHFWNIDRQDLPDRDILAESAQKLQLNLEKPLDQRMAKLDYMKVVFHAHLGTQGERILRIKQLACDIAHVVGVNTDFVERAAVLAKADLQSEAVGEFPELQGIMGREYALLQGEAECVADAIRDHYKPQGPLDETPINPVSISLAIADKLDMLIGFRIAGEWPTGSRDPYALRRVALGIVRIILENNIHLPFKKFIHLHWSRIAHTAPGASEKITMTKRAEGLESLKLGVLHFLHERLKWVLKNKGIRHDLIEACLPSDADDFLIVLRRAEALSAFVDTDKGKKLQSGIKRAVSILSAEEKRGLSFSRVIKEELFQQQEEKILFQILNQMNINIQKAILEERFKDAMEEMCALCNPVDLFFENVLVNHEEPKVKENRLALLDNIRMTAEQITDFSKISG